MDSFLILSTALLAFLIGLWCGKRAGIKEGQQDAINRLLKTKNSEVWDVAHMLIVELDGKITKG